MATTINSANMQAPEQLLALLQISSPTLPIGAFAYSQGLETAIDRGWCSDANDIFQWLEDTLTLNLQQQDLPLYLRFYQAWKDREPLTLNFWNQTLLALRETKELYLEEAQIGQAFYQWHLGQADNEQSEREELLHWCETPTAMAMNALATVLADININHALLGYCWGWLENQITGACKALPMGQLDAQRILQQMQPAIITACAHAQTVDDDDIGNSLYGLALASSWHETQYSRLFRS